MRSHEYRELTGNFDGYTLYNHIEWTACSSCQIEARGVFTEIPFRGLSGWVCKYDSTATPVYSCVSRFVDSADFHEAFPPDFTIEEPSDRPDKYGVSYDNGNWVCNVETESTTAKATCTSWLPGARGIRDYPALYRYEPEDAYKYQQYAYTFLDVAGDGGSAKTWVDLGQVTLAGAFVQSFSFVATTMSLFYIFENYLF